MDDARQRADAEPGDDALWDGYCAGDADALRALVRRHKDELYWYLLLSTGRPDEAARHSIQTWVLVARCARAVEGFSSFRGWLYAVATQNDLVAEVRRGRPGSERGRIMTRLIEMHRRLRQPLLLVTLAALGVEEAARVCNYTAERTVRALDRACRVLGRSDLFEPQEGADGL